MSRLIYVLLSGGIDSATALGRAHGSDPDDIRCVSMDYAQRHRRELEAAVDLAEWYDCAHTILQMPMGRTMLTDPTIEVPNVSYSEIQGVSPAYAPFRNGLMLSMLASEIAGQCLDPAREESELIPDLIEIWWGAHAEDAAGGAYPDCTAEFVGAMACAIALGTSHKIRLVAPFTAMSKAEVIRQGDLLRVPYRLTWSCYRGGEKHCGVCPACRARKSGFLAAGVDDPTEYEK